jgi:methanogenic corrinoid protein MtbC1
MSGSRQLIDVLSAWQSCEDLCSGQDVAYAKRESKPVKADEQTLARTIENQIIPRLMLTHRLTAERSIPAAALTLDSAHVEELARLVLHHDASVGASYIETLRAQGVSVDAVFLQLMAPAARRLGVMWSDDTLDFTDVTVGLSRLQQLCHELSPDFESESMPQFDDRRILLATVPGEQHTLGLMLVEEYFRRAGWECSSVAPKSSLEITRIVKRQHFDVVGFSVSCGILLESVASAIQTVRKFSRNKSVTVLVGGSIFLEHPEYAVRVGADGTAEDGRQAVLNLRDLMGGKAKSIR